MRTWKTLSVVLSLLSVLSGPASAVVFSRGVACSSLGLCVLNPSADQNSLELSGLTDSGSDGVKIILDRMTGHSCSLSSSWSSSDAGASLSYEWTLIDSPAGSPSCTMQRTSSSVLLTGNLWVFGGAVAAPPRRVLAIQKGVVVASVVLSSSNGLELRPQPGSPVQIPTMAFDTDGDAHLSVCMVTCASSVHCVIDGVDVVCDQVAVVADLDGDGLLSECRITGKPPASTTSGTVDISSQSVTRFGHTMTAQGHMHFSGQPDVLALDLDNDGRSDALTDGLMLIRYLFGLTGSALTQGAIGTPVHLTPDPPPAEVRFHPSAPETCDPSSDDEFSVSLTGRNSCSPDGEVARLLCHEVAHVVQISSRFSGMCADQESVYVSNQGHLVARVAISVDGSVAVVAPPGGPLTGAVCSSGAPITKSSSNIQNNLVVPGNDARTGPAGAVTPGSPSSSSVVGPDGVSLHMAFLDQRLFIIGNDPPVLGDDITFRGMGTTPLAGSARITLTGTNFTVTNTGGSTTGTIRLESVSSSGIDQVVATLPPTAALSTTHTVLDVPVDFERVDTTPLRGFSVTLSTSPGVQFAGPVVESDYLSKSGQTQCFVTTNPDHSITVDCAILGPGCGPTTGGRLFTVPVALDATVPVTSGIGYIDISVSVAADCNAGPIPAEAGGKSFFLVDTTPPTATVVSLAQQTSGNDGDGTSKIVVSVTPRDAASTLELFRAPFGNYPEYDDGPGAGATPTLPSYPPPASWTKLAVSACGAAPQAIDQFCDEPATRDTYYYVAFQLDRAGNVSPVSNLPPGMPNYFLGDVSNGVAVCTGDNQVTTADISALASHYGQSLPVGSPFECLDIGPTEDGSVHSRPLTDHKLSFADLIRYAINYLLVSSPASAPRAAASGTDALRLRVPPLPGVGQTFDVTLELSGAGDVQGLSAQLAFDPGVVEPVGVSQGELLGRQGRQGVVLSSAPGDVDAALLGVGGGFSGEGDLARVTFRVKAAGVPGIGIASIDARDRQNQAIALSGVGVPSATPAHTALRMAFPNPFQRSTTVVFALQEAGSASVRVYDVAGRSVRTLLNGVQAAGERVLAWDGRGDSGAPLSAGVYMLRLEAGGHQETRVVRLVK